MITKIFKSICTICIISVLFSCSDDAPFITASPDDTPRFLAPSSIEGNVRTSEKLNRNEVFTMDVVVTPANYTTIEWISDGEVLGTGATFNKEFEAGDYELTIMAKTQTGKQAYRIVDLSVSPIDGDPVASSDGLSRFQDPGAIVTLSGSNLGNIKKVKINGREIDVTNATSGEIQFTIPADIPEGSYRLSMINAEGVSYGGGYMTISNQAIFSQSNFMGKSTGQVKLTGRKLDDVATVTVNDVACTIVSKDAENIIIQLPELEEGTYALKATTTNGTAVKFLNGSKLVDAASIKVSLIAAKILWEGDVDINWGTSNVLIPSATMAQVNVGATIRLEYDIIDMPEGYHAMRITTNWWGDGAADQVVPQFDLTSDTPNPFEFTYTEANNAIVQEREGMLIVGYGYKLKRVLVVEDDAPVEVTLWEGNKDINWGTENVLIPSADMEQVPVGATVNLYYDIIDMPEGYHAMRITTNWWGDGAADQVVPQFDLTSDTPNPFEFTYTEANNAIVQEREGMLIVGYGYKLKRVTFTE